MTHYRDLKQHTHEVSSKDFSPGSAPQGDRIRISRRAFLGQALEPVTRIAQPWRISCATLAHPFRLAATGVATHRDSGEDANHHPDRSVNSIYRDVRHEVCSRRTAHQPDGRDPLHGASRTRLGRLGEGHGREPRMNHGRGPPSVACRPCPPASSSTQTPRPSVPRAARSEHDRPRRTVPPASETRQLSNMQIRSIHRC